MNALIVIRQSMKTFYEEFFALLVMGFVTVLAALLVIPGPFAVAGLWTIAQHAVEGRDTSWRTFWAGIKQYGPRNWGNTLLFGLGYALLAVNLWFYTNPAVTPISATVSTWLAPVWIAVGVFWTAAAFYMLAFQLEMLEPQIWLALRNSIFLTLLHPVQTLIWLLLLGLLGVLGYVLPPLVVLYPGFAGVLSMTATKSLLKAVREAKEEQSCDVAPN